MIAYIRHSERLDHVDKKKWKNSKRYSENKYDTPITRNGIKIAKKSINKLLKLGYNKINYLYSSPFSRCIETCLVLKKEIKDKLNKDIKIRIEYGLCEIKFNNIIFKNNKFKYNKIEKYLDDELKLENIIKRYGNNFDLKYKSKYKFEDISFEKEELSFFNRSINIYKKIKKLNGVIVCTHSKILLAIYSYLKKKNINWKNYSMVAKDYCSIVLKDKKKIKLIN
jgi:broad specificity phosphatase PhoE